MSRIIALLKTGSLECQDSYNDIEKYWEIETPTLLQCKFEERQDRLKSLESNFVKAYSQQIEWIVEDLEYIAQQFLGCKLRIWNRTLTISMVEIYADGIWDTAGDFLKGMSNYVMKDISSNIPDNADAIIEKIQKIKPNKYGFLNKLLPGPRVYFYNGRMDIKILGQFLPFSFLIRQFQNEKGEFVDIKGVSHNIIDALNKRVTMDESVFSKFGSAVIPLEYLSNDQKDELRKASRTKSVLTDNQEDEVSLQDRSKEFQARDYRQRRVESNRATGLNGRYIENEWNFS